MSLLAWYPLIDGFKNQGIADASPIITTQPILVDGILGTCVSNGAFKWTAEQTGKIFNNQEMSFTFWIKPTISEGTSGSWRLFNNETNTSVTPAIRRDFTIFLYPTVNDLHCSWAGITGSVWNSVIPSNKWTNVAITYKNPNGTIYINGIKHATFSGSNTLTDFSQETTVFNNHNGILRNDYRVYNHCLSAKEVKEISKGLTIHLPLNWGGNPNLIQGVHTRAISGSGGTFTREVLSDDKGSYIRLTCTVAGYGPYWSGFGKTDPDGTTRVGRKFTWSCMMRSSKSTTRTAGHECGGLKDIALTTEWKTYTHTWTMTDGTYTAWRVYNNYAVGDWIELRDLKIEESEIATPWLPNSSDIEYTYLQFDKIFQSECSGYNRVTTSNGTITPVSNTPKGSGISFNNSNIVVSSGFPKGDNMPKWSISLWYKPNSGYTFSSWNDVFSFWINTEAGNNTIFRLENQNTTGNSYQLYYNNYGQGSYGGGAFTLELDKWHHLAFCCDGTKVYQYVNNVLKITHTLNAGYKPTGTTGQFRISDVNLYSDYSDVRVYSTCLSAEDIAELYHTPISIDKSGKLYCGNLVEK